MDTYDQALQLAAQDELRRHIATGRLDSSTAVYFWQWHNQYHHARVYLDDRDEANHRVAEWLGSDHGRRFAPYRGENIRMPAPVAWEPIAEMYPAMETFRNRLEGIFNNTLDNAAVGLTDRMLNTLNKEGSNMEAQAVAPPLPQVNPILEKAITTANLLGIRLTTLQREHIATLATQAEANKYIMSLRTGTAEVVLPEAMTALLRDVVSAKQTNTYKNVQANIASYTRSIEDYRARINNTMAALHQQRLELIALEARPSQDMNDEVKKCLADGWWELDSINNTEIKFVSNDITCSHVDTQAGVNMVVPLGRMILVYRWSDGYTKLLKFSGNTCVTHGYWHPHVGTDGGICWGNTENTVYKARAEHKLHTILTAVRQLLAVYNPESPYAKLLEWDLIVNKAKYEGKGKVYKMLKDIPYGRNTGETRVVIQVNEGDDPPSDDYIEYTEAPDTSSGNDEYTYYVYCQVYEGINEPVTAFRYIKHGDEYIRFNDYNWKWL